MARYSTSYYKFGRQALNDVLNVFDTLRKQREEKEFYNNLLDIYNKAAERQKQLSEGFDPNDIKYVPNLKPQEIQLSSEPENKINLETPGDYILGDYIPAQSEIMIGGQKVTVPNPDRYQRARNVLSEFQQSILPSLIKNNLDENKIAKINLLGNLLTQTVENLKPQQPETFNLGRGETRFLQYPGQIPIKIAEGQKYETAEKNPFMKVGADGFVYQWDSDKNQFVKTNLRAPAKDWESEKIGDSVSWANYALNLRKYLEGKEKEQKQKSEELKSEQEKYNIIMSSPYLTKEELIKQGFDIEQLGMGDNEGYRGAYMVRDEKAPGGYRFILTEKELQNFASSKVPKAPNKWKRLGYSDKQKLEVYKDRNSIPEDVKNIYDYLLKRGMTHEQAIEAMIKEGDL